VRASRQNWVNWFLTPPTDCTLRCTWSPVPAPVPPAGLEPPLCLVFSPPPSPFSRLRPLHPPGNEPLSGPVLAGACFHASGHWLQKHMFLRQHWAFCHHRRDGDHSETHKVGPWKLDEVCGLCAQHNIRQDGVCEDLITPCDVPYTCASFMSSWQGGHLARRCGA
jgi:hypothetical protein